MKKFLTAIATVSLCLSAASFSFADSALTPVQGGLIDGDKVDVKVLYEVPTNNAYIGVIHTGSTSPNVTWTQPFLQIDGKPGVFGICVDTLHYTAANTTEYTVGGYQDHTSNIESADAWNKLTYMWSKANVNSDLDRAALQLATWKGCAGDWNTTRTNFWTSGDAGSVFYVAGDAATRNSAVLAKANTYLDLLTSYNGQQVGGYKLLVSNTRHQNFAVASVPEPSSILAALSVLGPVGLVFRRRGK